MLNNHKEKINFILENYIFLQSLHYSYRFALLEYIFFDIDELNNENISYMKQLYQLFDTTLVDERSIVHVDLPIEANYMNVMLMLEEYKERFDYLLKIDEKNKQKFWDSVLY